MKKILMTTTILIAIIFVFTGCGDSVSNEEPSENTTTSQETEAGKPVPEYTDFSYVKELSSEDGYGMDVNGVLLTQEGTAVMRTEGELGDVAGWEVGLADDVKDIYIEPFGNGGFYAILLIKNDGTISEVNASTLINDKKIEVLDRLGGYENISSIESVKNPDAYGINAVMENGEKFPLDPYLK